jgi:diacylglycerol kinase family enzyme
MTIVDEVAAAALRGRVVAVLNTASGSADPSAEADTRAIFAAAGLPQAEVISAGPAEIETVLSDALAGAAVLVVLGGDGTIRSAASQCGSRKVLLVPLPGGTLNMLPAALYGPRSWRDALRDTLARPVVHDVSGGVAGNEAFFVAALLGAPTLWADAREAIRAGRFLEAVKCAITAARRSFSDPLAYRFGDKLHGKAEAVAVICPLISRVMDNDERSLEAVAVDTPGAAEALRLGFHALFADWRADPAVARAQVRNAMVTGHGRVQVILDGEPFRMGRTVLIRFTPLAFRALAPAVDDTA